jgi:hypothetical protein
MPGDNDRAHRVLAPDLLEEEGALLRLLAQHMTPIVRGFQGTVIGPLMRINR